MKECKDCKYFTPGMTDKQRHEWSYSNWGRWADGICNLYFPRGYLSRKPPHAARSTGHCFQWEAADKQMTIDDFMGEI